MPASLEVGAFAPAFALPDGEGGIVTLADHLGRPVVLYFYPKDDTSGCTTEALDFSALAASFAAADTAVIGMSPDTPQSHGRFRDKYNLSIRLASDETKEALADYGVWVEKAMYGRRYMGVERTTVLIDRSGRVARVWRKVKVACHAAEVLTAAQALATAAR